VHSNLSCAMRRMHPLWLPQTSQIGSTNARRPSNVEIKGSAKNFVNETGTALRSASCLINGFSISFIEMS